MKTKFTVRLFIAALVLALLAPLWMGAAPQAHAQIWLPKPKPTATPPAPTPTPKPPLPTPTPSPSNTLRPADHPGFCLNLHNNQGSDDAVVNLWSCNGHNSQRWLANPDQTLRPADYPGFCLNLHNNQGSDGAVVNLWSCNGHNSQRWTHYQ
jgi:hypothetical protein